MDKFNKKIRGKIMSKICSENTEIEKRVFSGLRLKRIYFQKHYKKIDGKPDIAIPRKKKAVFIDGDFWHGYKFNKLVKRLPRVYWEEKIGKNRKRDKANLQKLNEKGWSVLRVWEHELKGKSFEKAINKIYYFLTAQ